MSQDKVILDFLQNIVNDEVWKNNRSLVNSICNVYLRLVKNHDNNFGSNFGSPDFWKAALGNYTLANTHSLN